MTRLLRRGLLLAWLALSAGSAVADDPNYVFTLNWQSGPLAGTSSTGSLSFDDALAVPNAQYAGAGILSSFSLAIGSTFYDLASVSVGYLWFDAHADIRLLGVGSDCVPGGCNIDPFDPTTFLISYDPQSQLDKFFGVVGNADSGQSFATGSFVLAPVPEPSTWVLLLAGTGLLAWRRRGAPRAA